MHLRAITLAGFKTFAKHTEIRFDGGATAIVGPNGSGKTNILDAFRWVLGETSAKDLRGKSMTEVIYAGGERRAKAGTAEVAIVIDNSDRRLPVDYEEVEIKRRVDRTGASDYFLNGSRVRRRDLIDLLASTGLTTDSYSIVTQRDIESIVTCSPEQRRQLIEEAAQVRGVKAKRSEAADKLRDLALNLERLADVRGEIEPRLEVVRAQAEAAREAAEAIRRLDLLKGSILHEEWREARDLHRKTSAQLQGLEKKLEEARAAAAAAESEFQAWRSTVQAQQDRRLQRQRAVSAIRLELSNAQHQVAMAEERARSQVELARAARAEEGELGERVAAATRVRDQLAAEAAAAQAELERLPGPPPAPPAADAERAAQARRQADEARRAVEACRAALAAAAARRQFLEEAVARQEPAVVAAEAELAAARAAAESARGALEAAQQVSAELARLKAELQGIESLRPAPRGNLRRLGDVVTATPGHESALSAALGPLVDAWAAPDEAAARAALEGAKGQTTVFFPVPGGAVETGSLVAHVRCEAGYEALAERLLGSVVLGRDVTADGVFAGPGMLRSGPDPRVGIAARRRQVLDRIAALEAAPADPRALAEAARSAGDRVSQLAATAAGRQRLEENRRQLEAARAAEAADAERLPRLEQEASEAVATSESLAGAAAEHQRLVSEHRSELARLESERARWRDRVRDLERQRQAAAADVDNGERARAARHQRAETSERQAAALTGSLPALTAEVDAVKARLAAAEQESPEEEAELAAAARRLVELEEARVDSRLRVGTFEGNAGLLQRELELVAAKMEELRSRMPEGLAPEEIPGGKSREREMHQLERRLREIGPTNPLAEAEHAELQARWSQLETQLADIASARDDLEQLIGRLREEEETRYDAVFGAVAAGFQEFFTELSGGGKATLRHTAGSDGPRSGVEILVQPVKKKLQTVTLLSSGERSMTALALVLALASVNPSPFTILDEVDAALDDANVGRFGEALTRLARERQFLVITHNHLTMACASNLYGIHLDESGCSHVVSVRLEDIRPPQRLTTKTA